MAGDFVLIKTITGASITINVDLQGTVASLKSLIREQDSFYRDKGMKLIMDGVKLEAKQTLAACGVTHGSQLYLVPGVEEDEDGVVDVAEIEKATQRVHVKVGEGLRIRVRDAGSTEVCGTYTYRGHAFLQDAGKHDVQWYSKTSSWPAAWYLDELPYFGMYFHLSAYDKTTLPLTGWAIYSHDCGGWARPGKAPMPTIEVISAIKSEDCGSYAQPGKAPTPMIKVISEVPNFDSVTYGENSAEHTNMQEKHKQKERQRAQARSLGVSSCCVCM